MWLYQHYILAYLTWPLLVYDFPLSFAKELQKEANKRIKQWLKINKKANVSILYRSRKNKGLQLCSVSKCLKRSQGTKAHIIKHSTDPNMLKLHAPTSNSAADQRDRKPATALEAAQAEVNFNFQGHEGKSGLGLIPTNRPVPNSSEHRQLVTTAICAKDEHEQLIKVMDFAMQGAWTKWDNVMSFDFSWNNLIYHLPPKLLSFILNATQMTLPTPDRLRVWNIVPISMCKLCSHPNCSLFHILCNCPFSSQQEI